jgi:GNAT superfamily N-acetyltransferase
VAEIRIEPATPADVPLLLSLIRALAEYEKLSHQVVVTEATLYDHLFGDRPVADAMIARVGDVAVGYSITCAKYSSFTGPGLFLEDVFVLPEHRGSGVGRMLLREAARLARERGCARLEWAVLDWNDLAIGFYRRIGADVLPDWRICRMNETAIRKLADGE